MTAPAVEIVISADTTISTAMIEATAEGLPPSARVQVVERATPNADVVVTVRWAGENERRATLHVRTRDGREAERVLMFGASDPNRERGRALGFAIAAMIPEYVAGGDRRSPGAAPQDIRGSEEPKTPTRLDAPEPAPPRMTVPPEAGNSAPSIADAKLWVDASAQGATGFVGRASSIGGAIAVRTLLPPFALRVGGAARAGEVPEANASSVLFRGDAGIGFNTVAFAPRVMLGGRAGLVVFHHSLARTTNDGTRTSGAHTLFGAEVMLEGSFTLSSRFALVAAVGSEVAFGTTRVLIGPTRVAIIPAVRPIAEVGVRIAF